MIDQGNPERRQAIPADTDAIAQMTERKILFEDARERRIRIYMLNNLGNR
jgi:hypothetical protein